MNLEDFVYSVDYKWLNNINENKTSYNFTDKDDRAKYFQSKIGLEIEKLKKFMKNNTFIGYLIAPKNAGKGTYLSILKELLGEESFSHISVGDIVRRTHEEYEKECKNSKVYEYIVKNYRGLYTPNELFDSLVNRTTAKLILTEIIIMLIKREIDLIPRKTIFIDGFPRQASQIESTLFMRDILNYRNDPDLFVFINLPMQLIDERIKGRRTCPSCKFPYNMPLLPSSDVRFDKEKHEFYYVCDKPYCSNHQRAISKEGDELGIKNIEERIVNDLKLMEIMRKVYGVPKIELYNSLEIEKAFEYCDEYEYTKSYRYEINDDKINIIESNFEIVDHGKRYLSLKAESVIPQFIKQLVDVFKL